ncbi:MAG: hypothetical protein AB8B67_03660 [Rickettsiaceae bacterium]
MKSYYSTGKPSCHNPKLFCPDRGWVRNTLHLWNEYNDQLILTKINESLILHRFPNKENEDSELIKQQYYIDLDYLFQQLIKYYSDTELPTIFTNIMHADDEVHEINQSIKELIIDSYYRVVENTDENNLDSTFARDEFVLSGAEIINHEGTTPSYY